MISVSTMNEYNHASASSSVAEPMDVAVDSVQTPMSPPSVRMQCLMDVAADRRSSNRSSKSIQKRRPSAFKFASFEADAFDDSRPHCEFYEPTHHLYVEDIQTLWWTKSECKKNFDKHCRSIVTTLRDAEHHSEYRIDFEDLFCRCADPKRRIRSLLKNYLEMQSNRTCRGLEQKVHSILSVHRRTYVSGIVKLQAKLRVAPPPPPPSTTGTPQPGTLSPAQIEIIGQVLQAKALQLSRPSKVLARLVAHGDALDVARIIQEGFDGQTNSR